MPGKVPPVPVTTTESKLISQSRPVILIFPALSRLKEVPSTSIDTSSVEVKVIALPLESNRTPLGDITENVSAKTNSVEISESY